MDRAVIHSRAGGFKVNWNQKFYSDSLSYFVVTKGNTTKLNNGVRVDGDDLRFRTAPTAATRSHHYYLSYRIDTDGTYTRSSWNGVFPSSFLPSGIEGWNRGIAIASSGYCPLISLSTTGTYIELTDHMIIDLTQMFGEGNEPNTVEEFQSWLAENDIDISEYIPYDAGSVRYMSWPSWIEGSSRYRVMTTSGAYSVRGNKARDYEVVWNQHIIEGDMSYSISRDNTAGTSRVFVSFPKSFKIDYIPDGDTHILLPVFNIIINPNTKNVGYSSYVYGYQKNSSTFKVYSHPTGRHTLGYLWGVKYDSASPYSPKTQYLFTSVDIGAYIDATFLSFCVFDTTQMFGAGNEPTVEQFQSWLAENDIDISEYIPYDVGTTKLMTKPSWIE